MDVAIKELKTQKLKLPSLVREIQTLRLAFSSQS